MSEILERLYLGDRIDSGNLEFLDENSITHILDCTYELRPRIVYPARITYLKVDMYDTPDFQIENVWDKCQKFMRDSLAKKEGILVHCSRGVSRSASIVISYIMKRRKWSFKKTLDFVKKRRKQVHPNWGFVRKMIDYEKEALEEKDNILEVHPSIDFKDYLAEEFDSQFQKVTREEIQKQFDQVEDFSDISKINMVVSRLTGLDNRRWNEHMKNEK